MTTLTEKRISARLSRCSEDACSIYEKAFPIDRADEEFWQALDVVDGKLAAHLAKPQLGAQDVERIFKAFTKKFVDLVQQARKRAAEGRQGAG